MKNSFAFFIIWLVLSSCSASPEQVGTSALIPVVSAVPSTLSSAVPTTDAAPNGRAVMSVVSEAGETPAETALTAIYNVSEATLPGLETRSDGTPLVPFSAPGSSSLFGLCDTNGNIVVHPVYSSVTRAYYGGGFVYALTRPLDGGGFQLTVSSPDAKTVYTPLDNATIADSYGDGGNGYILLGVENGYRLLMIGEGIIAESEYIGRMSQGLAPVKTGSSYSYIGTDGAAAFPESYQYAGSFYSDRAAVCQNDLWGLIDTSGEWAVLPEYQSALEPSGGVCAVSKNGVWGMINANGEQLFPFEYLSVNKVGNKMYLLEREGESFYFDASTGKVIKSTATLRYLQGGVFADIGADRISLIFERDGTTETIIGAESVKALDSKHFEIVINGRLGLYKSGEGFIFQPNGAEIAQSCIYDGVAVVKGGDGALGVYSLAGNQILPFEYDRIEPLGFGLYSVTKGLNSGIINENAEWLLRF